MEIIIKFNFTPAGGAVITDRNGNDLYIGKGKFISLMRTKKLKNLDGDTLYVIRNKFIHLPFHKTAIIKDEDGVFGKMSLTPSLKYVVKNCVHDIVIEGGLFTPSFAIYKDGLLACKGRSEASLNGKFAIDVPNENDAPLIIAILLAMNNIRKNNK